MANGFTTMSRGVAAAGAILTLGSLIGSAMPAQAKPPDWAPAHGYRRKVDQQNHHHDWRHDAVRREDGNWRNSTNQQRRWLHRRDQDQRILQQRRDQQRKWWQHRTDKNKTYWRNHDEQQRRHRADQQRKWWQRHNAQIQSQRRHRAAVLQSQRQHRLAQQAHLRDVQRRQWMHRNDQRAHRRAVQRRHWVSPTEQRRRQIQLYQQRRDAERRMRG